MANQQIQFQQGMSIPEFLGSFGTEAQCAEAVKRLSGRGGRLAFSVHVARQLTTTSSVMALAACSSAVTAGIRPR